MRESLVNRSVLALSGAFVGACIAFALAVEPASQTAPATDMTPGDMAPATDASAGSKLHEMRCERCHTLDESLAPLRDAEPGTDARAAYLAVLQRHRKASTEENVLIIDFLQSRMDGSAASSPSSRQ